MTKKRLRRSEEVSITMLKTIALIIGVFIGGLWEFAPRFFRWMGWE